MRKRLLLKIITRLVAFCVAIFFAASVSFAQSRGRAAHNTRTNNSPVANPPPNINLPYKVEIGDGMTPPGFVVTLAVGAFTVVRCPEPGLNLIFGHPAEIEYQESVDGQKQYQLYLRPRRAGIYMNVGIEMPSGLVTFYVRSVAIKGGARVGDFNGEVIIRPSGYRDELAEARARVSELEKKVSEEEVRLAAAETTATERVTAAQAMAQRDVLTVIEGITQPLKPGRAPVVAEHGRMRIVQLGGTIRTPQSVWAVFSIENRDSRMLTLEEVRADGARVRLTSNGARQITGRSKGSVAVCLEPEKDAPRRLTFVINGAQVAVPLVP